METLSSILKTSHFENASLEERFLVLMRQFTAKANTNGYKIKPATTDSWSRFCSLPDEKKQEIFNTFLVYYKVCASALESGHPLSNTMAMIWCLFKEMEWRPASDLFDKIQDTDVIEVYGSDFRQIFRNMNFFDICSYSLTEIFTYDWRDLYRRDDSITIKLAEKAGEVLTGKVATVPIGVDWHYLEEVFSENQNKIYIVHKFLSPLYNKQNQIVAFVAISDGRVTASLRSLETSSKDRGLNSDTGRTIEA